MTRDTLSDRLARLTYLCTEISKIAEGEHVPTEELQRLLTESESLCGALRREIDRRRKQR